MGRALSRDGREKGSVGSQRDDSVLGSVSDVLDSFSGFAGLGKWLSGLLGGGYSAVGSKNVVLVDVGIGFTVARRGQASHADMEIQTTGSLQARVRQGANQTSLACRTERSDAF